MHSGDVCLRRFYCCGCGQDQDTRSPAFDIIGKRIKGRIEVEHGAFVICSSCGKRRSEILFEDFVIVATEKQSRTSFVLCCRLWSRRVLSCLAVGCSPSLFLLLTTLSYVCFSSKNASARNNSKWQETRGAGY